MLRRVAVVVGWLLLALVVVGFVEEGDLGGLALIASFASGYYLIRRQAFAFDPERIAFDGARWRFEDSFGVIDVPASEVYLDDIETRMHERWRLQRFILRIPREGIARVDVSSPEAIKRTSRRISIKPERYSREALLFQHGVFSMQVLPGGDVAGTVGSERIEGIRQAYQSEDC